MTKAPLHSHCEHCLASFVHRRPAQRFCSHWCSAQHRAKTPRPRPSYAHNGRLSDELQREVAAARAEQATAPLYRPGGVL